MSSKVDWQGEISSVQPRIRLLRSFDERSHSYLGHVLQVRGTRDGKAGQFIVALGKGANEKHRFCVGDQVSGKGAPVADPRLETAELYKVSGLRVTVRGGEPGGAPSVPPENRFRLELR